MNVLRHLCRLPCRIVRAVRQSLSHRITLYALTLAGLFVGATGALSYGALRTQLTDSIETGLRVMAFTAAERLEFRLGAIHGELTSLAANTLMANGLVDAEARTLNLQPFLSEHLTLAEVPARLCLGDFTGDPLACNGESGFYRPESSWVETVVDRGQAHVAWIDGGHMLLAVPVVHRPTGRAEGVLVARFDVRPLVDEASAHVDPSMAARLLSNGTPVICHHCDIAAAGSPIAGSEALDELPAVFHRLQLAYAIDAPEADALVPLKTLRDVYLAVGLTALLLLAAGARLIALRLVRPIAALTGVAERVAAGMDLDAKVTVARSDEVGRLADAFQGMLEKLRVAYATQEERVQARTRELTERDRELAESEARYRALIAVAPDAILVSDLDGIRFANPAAVHLFGAADAAEIIGRRLLDFIAPAQRELVIGRLKTILETGATVPAARLDLTGLDHRLRHVESVSTGITYRGRPAAISLIRDVTERRRAEEHQQLAAAVFEYTREGILITAPDGTIVAVNRAFSQVTGYAAAEAIGKTPAILRSGRQSRGFYARMWHDLSTLGEWHGEIWNRRKDGEVYPEWLSIAAVRGPDGATSHYVAIFSDITAVKETEHRLEVLAYYDPLTGLPNRALFYERLHHALSERARSGKPLSLLFVDLDRFKVINDSLGHDVGDLLLKDVADRIRHAVRDVDTVARLGGDEFTVILESSADHSGVLEVVNRVHAVLAEPYELGGHLVYSGSSIGVASYPQDGRDADTLLKSADIAMYGAKQAGHHGFTFFEPAMAQDARDDLKMETELRSALLRRELVLHFQPQVSMADGTVVGYEALMRWQHPSRGLLLPADFLPAAEQSGLIRELDWWALRTACTHYRQMRDEGRGDTRIAVNFSGQHVHDLRLAEELAEVLVEFGLDGRWLEIEITEHSVMRHSAAAGRVLEAVKALGIAIAIDDFGTGYSSLGYIKQFPIDTLKIDRSFINGVPHDELDVSIVDAVLGMARALKLRVVAEGVETAEQLAFLRERGCAVGQGFLLGQPKAATDDGAAG